MTGAPGEHQRRLEQTVGSSGGGGGGYFTDLAGDGSTLVYSTVTMTQLDTCIDPGTPCFYANRVATSSVWSGASPAACPTSRLPPGSPSRAAGSPS